MSLALRALLLGGAVWMAVYILRKIRKAQMQIDDALFWILTAFLFVLLGIFPGLAVGAAQLLGIQSPANLVFLVAIFLLLFKTFALTRKISVLEYKLKYFAQTYAIGQALEEETSTEEAKR